MRSRCAGARRRSRCRRADARRSRAARRARRSRSRRTAPPRRGRASASDRRGAAAARPRAPARRGSRRARRWLAAVGHAPSARRALHDETSSRRCRAHAAGGSRRSIAATSSPMPPRSALKQSVAGAAALRRWRRGTAGRSRAAASERGATDGDRELLDVAGMDAAEQRLGDQVDRRRAESPPEERRRPISSSRSARAVAARASRQSTPTRRQARARPAAGGRSVAMPGHVVGMPRTDGEGSGCRRPRA